MRCVASSVLALPQAAHCQWCAAAEDTGGSSEGEERPSAGQTRALLGDEPELAAEGEPPLTAAADVGQMWGDSGRCEQEDTADSPGRSDSAESSSESSSATDSDEDAAIVAQRKRRRTEAAAGAARRKQAARGSSAFGALLAAPDFLSPTCSIGTVAAAAGVVVSDFVAPPKDPSKEVRDPVSAPQVSRVDC